MAPLAVVLGGNIATGKSTVGPLLAQRMGACYVPEPVQEWCHSGRLANYYCDPVGHASGFQEYVLSTRTSALNARLNQWRHAHGGAAPAIVVLDRWLDDDMIFAKASRARGYLTEDQFGRYAERHARTTQSLVKTLDVRRVWLHTPPELCLQRIRKRGRAEETTIEHEYLELLEGIRLTEPPCDLELPTVTSTPDALAQTIYEYTVAHWTRP